MRRGSLVEAARSRLLRDGGITVCRLLWVVALLVLLRSAAGTGAGHAASLDDVLLLSRLHEVTEVRVAGLARGPSLIRIGEDLFVLWSHPIPDTDRQALGLNRIPVGAARLGGDASPSPPDVRLGKGGPPVAIQIPFANMDGPYRPSLRFCVAKGLDSMAACLGFGDENRQSWDARLYMIPTDELSKGSLGAAAGDAKLWSTLPMNAIYGKNPTHSRPGVTYPVASEPYYQPRLCILPGGQQWLVVGVQEEGKVWISRSSDGGQSWSLRNVLPFTGAQPWITYDVERKRTLLFYVDSKVPDADPFPSWPDDLSPTHPRWLQAWPVSGPIMVRQSTNGGVTWGKARTAVASSDAIEGQACQDSSGRLWVIYTKSSALLPRLRTELWLACSPDGGRTWLPGRQLTDGKYLDREPDVLSEGDNLVVAMSRGAPGMDTGIWVGEVASKRWFTPEVRRGPPAGTK